MGAFVVATCLLSVCLDLYIVSDATDEAPRGDHPMRDHTADAASSPPVAHVSRPTRRRHPWEAGPCACKKTHAGCLRKYCECFAAGVVCDGCNCISCENTSGAFNNPPIPQPWSARTQGKVQLVAQNAPDLPTVEASATSDSAARARFHVHAIQPLVQGQVSGSCGGSMPCYLAPPLGAVVGPCLVTRPRLWELWWVHALLLGTADPGSPLSRLHTDDVTGNVLEVVIGRLVRHWATEADTIDVHVLATGGQCFLVEPPLSPRPRPIHALGL